MTRVRANIFSGQHHLQVFLDWEAETDEDLHNIAKGTLGFEGVPRPAQPKILKPAELKSFVVGVRREVGYFLDEAYKGVGIDFLTKRPPPEEETGPLYTIRFGTYGGELYGFANVVCGDRRGEAQVAKVYVSRFKRAFTEFFPDWLPMKDTDSLSVRMKDVGHAIGRTAAHELAHVLGLVSNSGQCKWMRGDGGFHNLEKTDEVWNTDRASKGYFIMDPKPEEHYRLGYPGEKRKAEDLDLRRPSAFNSFNRSYLVKLLSP